MPDDAPREDEHKDDEPEVAAPAPPGDEVAAALLERFAGAAFHESHGQPVVYVDRAHWADAAMFLRDEQQFTMLLDVTAVDHLLDVERISIPGVAAERYEVVANYLSHPRNRRIRVITEVPADDVTLASLAPLYESANLAEREVYDLFGVVFEGHPDLTRILMPDDWVGHPLRKDDSPARVPVTFKGDPGPR
jgi:NADH:ubiquinone oxidoreductase subunit C